MAAKALRFHAAFERWARRVRSRQAARSVLSGAAVGLVVGAAAAGVLWRAREGTVRPWAGAAGIVGAAVGLGLARKRAWSDSHVALYLDGCLDSREAIATAVEMSSDAREAADDPARAVVLEQAAEALDKADPKRVRPRVLAPLHAALPAGVLAIAWIARMPLPPLPSSAVPPGGDRIKLAEVAGLERIAQLGQAQARDDDQKKRLEKLAEEARRLREKLRDGMEKREAQADIAKLRDEITAERLSLGSGEHRAGLEAAVGRLAQDPSTKDAAKALGDRDMTAFDEELEKLADAREKKDREEAHRALDEAADAAKKGGAKDVARELERQRELMKKREARSDALRELGEALGKDLPDGVKRDLDEFDRAPSGKSAQKLAESMGKALEKLTPEERKRLAEQLKKKLEGEGAGGHDPEAKRHMRELADELSTPEGQKKLEEQLRQMANEGLEGDESKQQKQLGEAERGGAEAEGQIGGRPMPMPMAGGGDDRKPGKEPGGPSGSGDAKGKDGTPGGHHEDTGHGDHAGHTDPVDANGIRAKARAKVGKGVPLQGVGTGRTEGRAGETANVQGTGALGNVAPDEVGGVERSDVPEEYREQVGRYFQP